jgi:hypothetical protein
MSSKAPGATPRSTQTQMAELRESVIAVPIPRYTPRYTGSSAGAAWICLAGLASPSPDRTMSKWLGKLKLTRLQPSPRLMLRRSAPSSIRRENCRLAIELRPRFPGVTDNAKARACARSIAGWAPLDLC